MSLSEGKHTAQFLLSEAPGTGSRDTVTVTVGAAETLQAGTVLGKITGTGKYVPYDDGNNDGSQTARAVLYGTLVNADAAPADISGVAITNNAEVREADLVFESGVDEAGGLVDLLAFEIKAR